MKITPLDILNHKFKKKFMGYDKIEVDIFLEMVANEMEQYSKENAFLTEELKRKSNQISEFQERESTLKETLLTAQRLAQDMKSSMVKEAQVILGEAELEGERMIQHAQQRAIRLQEDIHEYKRMRIQLENELGSILKSHMTMLEAMAEGEAQESEMDDKLKIITAKIKK